MINQSLTTNPKAKEKPAHASHDDGNYCLESWNILICASESYESDAHNNWVSSLPVERRLRGSAHVSCATSFRHYYLAGGCGLGIVPLTPPL